MMILCLFLSQFIHAAPHKDFPQNVSIQSVKALLKKADQVDEIKPLGPQAYKHLREIMLSEKEGMTHRWNAVLAMARIGGHESQPDIDAALKHNTWFIRSAGLLASSIVHKEKGFEKAKQFLRRDPALLVRATALQVMAQEDNMDRDYLWTELHNPLNFHKGQSLSLRLSILKILSKNVRKTESAKFVALMRESDPAVQSLAKDVLEKQFFISKNSVIE